LKKDYLCIRQKSNEMNKVILNIPENINLKTFDFSVYVASKMYEDGLVSAGQASEMVGISKRAFIELLGKYGVSLFSQSIEDLDKDIANA
jgi:predicted HTH domain antitoxin